MKDRVIHKLKPLLRETINGYGSAQFQQYQKWCMLMQNRH